MTAVLLAVGAFVPIPVCAQRLDGDRYVPHHLVVFLHHARCRQMEPLDRPDSVEPRRRVPVQGHRASLRLRRVVFGVPAEDVGPLSHVRLCSIQSRSGPVRRRPRMVTAMPENPSTRLPLYAQVEDILAARISSGALPVGTQLPSEEDLIREFNVSRTTIRATIQNLVRLGLVEIRRGRGTFVASPRIVQELTELTGFVEDMRVLGRIPTARVLSREVVSAAPLVAEKLACPCGDDRGAGSNAFASPTACRFLSTRLICRRTSAAGSWPTTSPTSPSSLCWKNDTTPRSSRPNTCWRPPLLSPQSPAALEIPVGGPIFLIERTSYTSGHRPVDYERLHYRGDTIRFKTRLARRRIPRAPKCD